MLVNPWNSSSIFLSLALCTFVLESLIPLHPFARASHQTVSANSFNHTMRFFFFFFSLLFFVLLLCDSSTAAEILRSDLPLPSCFDHGRSLPRRKYVASISDFGGVGDGVTLNTNAFRSAVYSLRSQASQGGVQLNVPKGTWITGSFNLTGHFTLYLQKDAEIVASEVLEHQPSHFSFLFVLMIGKFNE